MCRDTLASVHVVHGCASQCFIVFGNERVPEHLQRAFWPLTKHSMEGHWVSGRTPLLMRFLAFAFHK